MGYRMNNKLDKGCFELGKNNKVNESINYYLDKFNIDLNDYCIVKATKKYRILQVDEIEKYAGVICFNKEIFNKGDIKQYLDFINGLGNLIVFLHKPPIPKSIMKKVKIIGKK